MQMNGIVGIQDRDGIEPGKRDVQTCTVAAERKRIGLRSVRAMIEQAQFDPAHDVRCRTECDGRDAIDARHRDERVGAVGRRGDRWRDARAADGPNPVGGWIHWDRRHLE